MLDRCEPSEHNNPCTSRAEARMPEYSSAEEDISDSEPVQLQPFIHQVGGHSCVLRFNETTLCKPLITREHVFYESLPSGLKEFIPDYRGIIEVELAEDNEGSMTYLGYPVQLENIEGQGSCSRRSSPKGYHRGNSPSTSGSDTESSNSPVLATRQKHSQSNTNSYSVKLLSSGSIQVNTQTDALFHSPDPKSDQKSGCLNPWSLTCHKRQLALMRTDNQDSNMKKFILLENVAAKYQYPCILDIKMGTRQHGDDAPKAKKDSQMRKCAATTSSAVGVRLIGMQVYQSTSGQFVCQNKYFGRKLTVEGLKDILRVFLYDGEKLRKELIDPIVDRLHQLYKVVHKQETFRFYSSSLLIMYGGKKHKGVSNDNEESHIEHVHDHVNKHVHENKDTSHGEKDVGQLMNAHSCESLGKISSDGRTSSDSSTLNDLQNSETGSSQQGIDSLEDSNGLVDVRMIDFAHSTHQGFRGDEKHKGVDQGYLFGLQNLILLFEDIKKGDCKQASR